MIKKYFALDDLQTTVGQELRAGFASFLAMSYILFINPIILSSAFPDHSTSDLMITTAIAAAIGSFLMGFLARLPFCLAPGMGLNAYFSYSLVAQQGLAVGEALACVFLSGIIFLLISSFGIREIIVRGIPHSLKIATTCGIGVFIAFIGLKTGGVVVQNKATLVSLSDPHNIDFILSFLGFFILGGLLVRKKKAAFLWSIILISFIAVFFKLPVYGGEVSKGLTSDIFVLPSIPTDLFFNFNLASIFHLSFIAPILTLLFVDFFDTAGTLFGLSQQSGYLTKQGEIKNGREAFVADAIATTCSAAVGTSPTTTYIESAAGIEDGGKSGLTSVFVGFMFLMSIFVSSLIAMVPPLATAPTLIIVGAMMMKNMKDIEWSDIVLSISSFVTIIMMPLTFSISHGIAAGIVTYTLLRIFSGQARRVNKITYIIFTLIILRYVFLGDV